MKKQTQPQKTSVADFVQSIDSELNAREQALSNREDELNELQNSIASQKLELEASITSFSQEKADFERDSQEVSVKLAKIRSDVKLSEDLRSQAVERKDIEKMLKKVAEERALSEYNLEQVAKRELELSQREQKYKEEVEKKFVGTFFKG